MPLLNSSSEIWELHPTEADLMEAARYAAITLPWTFNRMSKNSSAGGMLSRAHNIAKGIVGQEVLKRELERRGLKVVLQRKSYRDTDLFDFKIVKEGKDDVKFDVKTFSHYSNYAGDERQPLTSDLISKFRSFSGPDWRTFFPMAIAHTQISQDKQAYCFAIASSIDFRKEIWSGRPNDKVVAFPYDEMSMFVSSKRLCIERENAAKGIFVSLYYENETLFKDKLKIRVVGEWNGKLREESVSLEPENLKDNIGPFSNILNIEIDRPNFEKLQHGRLLFNVSKNELKIAVRNSTQVNINIIPKAPLIFKNSDFGNVILPKDYKIYFIGWITKPDFMTTFVKYPAWIWPNDKNDKYLNQAWSQITDRDRQLLKKLSIPAAVKTDPSRIEAGLLKTGGLRGGSASCYVYPNMFGGGFRETNVYVLPADLSTMNSLI